MTRKGHFWQKLARALQAQGTGCMILSCRTWGTVSETDDRFFPVSSDFKFWLEVVKGLAFKVAGGLGCYQERFPHIHMLGSVL